jgi:hypothetical protein
MSGDDEIAVVEHEGYWYVELIMGGNVDVVHKSGKIFESKTEALMYAHELDKKEHTEYGVQIY